MQAAKKVGASGIQERLAFTNPHGANRNKENVPQTVLIPDRNPMPLVQPLVAALALVCEVESALSHAATGRASLNITETNRRIAEQFILAF